MPAQNERQANLFRMALAEKKGHRLKGIKNRSHILKIAKSMTEQQIRDFTEVKS